MTHSKKSNEKEQAGLHRNSCKQTPAFEKDQETLSTNLSINDVNIGTWNSTMIILMIPLETLKKIMIQFLPKFQQPHEDLCYQ
ncbi:7636_t:CDS:2 [Funneliformis mosseae]|uniref:7636_t:CDS:1 n=1 Tax=Funneliformis mosseae TaxID=27381 RepID=A0A9N9FQ37_FUNMO|nr:7636_t:CDS:2 [Funneliformis mosseae]